MAKKIYRSKEYSKNKLEKSITSDWGLSYEDIYKSSYPQGRQKTPSKWLFFLVNPSGEIHGMSAYYGGVQSELKHHKEDNWHVIRVPKDLFQYDNTYYVITVGYNEICIEAKASSMREALWIRDSINGSHIVTKCNGFLVARARPLH